jgi:osmotically inducible protein OsmC
MALSFQLTGAGFTPAELKTDAAVKVDQVEGGFKITSIKLTLTGQVPNITEEQFLQLANAAKEGCPVSQALSAVEITLDAKLG